MHYDEQKEESDGDDEMDVFENGSDSRFEESEKHSR